MQMPDIDSTEPAVGYAEAQRFAGFQLIATRGSPHVTFRPQTRAFSQKPCSARPRDRGTRIVGRTMSLCCSGRLN